MFAAEHECDDQHVHATHIAYLPRLEFKVEGHVWFPGSEQNGDIVRKALIPGLHPLHFPRVMPDTIIEIGFEEL